MNAARFLVAVNVLFWADVHVRTWAEVKLAEAEAELESLETSFEAFWGRHGS